MLVSRCAIAAVLLWLTGTLPAVAQTYEQLADPAGEPASAIGIYDPSLEYLPDGSMGWLFYSAVHPNGSPSGTGVSSRVAVTTSHGADWSFVAAISSSLPATAMSLGPNEPLLRIGSIAPLSP
ncbi:MAG: hypothetical protein GY725_26075 [bacterium]|nr:hypothetical protein [bacterium]